MLRPRIVPCLLLRNNGLIKTVQFKEGKYVGDPLNAVKIFNEKEVDELMVLDIDATAEGREPDYELIKNMALEARMPLCYGGGISSVYQALKIIGLGAEKLAISSAFIDNPSLVTEISDAVGVQSTIAVIDVKKVGFLKSYEVMTKNGKKKTGFDPKSFAQKLEQLGAGEIVVNSIDQDGMMQGYDMKLLRGIRDAVSIPLTAIGGAGSLEDLKQLVAEFGVIGAGAGSLFVFKGKYKAVLINYPSYEQRKEIYNFI